MAMRPKTSGGTGRSRGRTASGLIRTATAVGTVSVPVRTATRVGTASVPVRRPTRGGTRGGIGPSRRRTGWAPGRTTTGTGPQTGSALGRTTTATGPRTGSAPGRTTTGTGTRTGAATEARGGRTATHRPGPS